MNNQHTTKKNLVILSGAGISAESGIRTCRDMDGLWEEYDVMQVASIEGWNANPELVLQFYNERRHQLATVTPNAAHTIIADLEQFFDLHIITQNVDNLHEQAGSSNILHLHGELTKVRSTGNESDVRDLGYASISIGDVCEQGFQLRPHIVWFGEPVPAISEAIEIAQEADILIIIGTSLNVYPAASIVHYVPPHCSLFIIDPNDVSVPTNKITVIKEPASVGMKRVKSLLLEQHAK